MHEVKRAPIAMNKSRVLSFAPTGPLADDLMQWKSAHPGCTWSYFLKCAAATEIRRLRRMGQLGPRKERAA